MSGRKRPRSRTGDPKPEEVPVTVQGTALLFPDAVAALVAWAAERKGWAIDQVTPQVAATAAIEHIAQQERRRRYEEAHPVGNEPPSTGWAPGYFPPR